MEVAFCPKATQRAGCERCGQSTTEAEGKDVYRALVRGVTLSGPSSARVTERSQCHVVPPWPGQQSNLGVDLVQETRLGIARSSPRTLGVVHDNS